MEPSRAEGPTAGRNEDINVRHPLAPRQPASQDSRRRDIRYFG